MLSRRLKSKGNEWVEQEENDAIEEARTLMAWFQMTRLFIALLNITIKNLFILIKGIEKTFLPTWFAYLSFTSYWLQSVVELGVAAREWWLVENGVNAFKNFGLWLKRYDKVLNAIDSFFVNAYWGTANFLLWSMPVTASNPFGGIAFTIAAIADTIRDIVIYRRNRWQSNKKIADLEKLENLVDAPYKEEIQNNIKALQAKQNKDWIRFIKTLVIDIALIVSCVLLTGLAALLLATFPPAGLVLAGGFGIIYWIIQNRVDWVKDKISDEPEAEIADIEEIQIILEAAELQKTEKNKSTLENKPRLQNAKNNSNSVILALTPQDNLISNTDKAKEAPTNPSILTKTKDTLFHYGKKKKPSTIDLGPGMTQKISTHGPGLNPI